MLNVSIHVKCLESYANPRLCLGLICITVSNSPNPSSVYIRLGKHGKSFLLFKYDIALVFNEVLRYSSPLLSAHGHKRNKFEAVHSRLRCLNSQIVMRGNSCHQQFAKQTSSVAVTSDWSVVLYPGLCNMRRLIHGSFSGNPRDPHKAHTRSAPTVALRKKWNTREPAKSQNGI